MTAVETPNQPILSIGDWPTNGHMIADVAALQLIPEPVIDLTYGEGKFWTEYQPNDLTSNDLHKPADLSIDWTEVMPVEEQGQYGCAVFDPPYKLNGTPTDTDRYGVHEKVTVKERLRRIEVGARNATSLIREGGTLLVKVQNQVANGEMHWQTDMVDNAVLIDGLFKKEAMFHFLHTARPQRSQRRARNNYSTLLVYRRTARRAA